MIRYNLVRLKYNYAWSLIETDQVAMSNNFRIDSALIAFVAVETI